MNWIINFENGKSPCRVNQAATTVGPFIYSFGGYCQQTTVSELKCYSPIDVHVLDTINFKWHKRPKPQTKDPQYLVTPYFRYGHTCVTFNEVIYLWGGRADWTNSLCNTLFTYKPNEHIWNRIETDGNRPDGRDGHSACVVPDLNIMLIFGGYVQKIKKFSNDIFEYNFKTSTWTLIIPRNNIKPHWRDFHSASCVGTQMFIFGGRMDCGHETFTGESFYSNDLYMFDINKNVWTEVRADTSRSLESSANDSSIHKEKAFSPCGRRSHSAVVYKQKIIVFGGFQENIHKHFNDIYEYDVDKAEWKTLTPAGKSPSPRRRHSCCVIKDKMFLFGGTGPSADGHRSNTNNQQLALITNSTNQNDNFIQNIRIIEPALHQLELNLNQINNALRDRNSLNFNVLNNALAVALAALARPRLENTINNQLNNPINRPQIRYHPERVENLMIQEPQEEYNGQVQEYQEQERMEINEVNHNDDNPNNPINNYIVEEQDDDNVYNEEDDLMDSGDEDLIDEGTEDEEDFNQGLISLSDLHVLDLEVPTLRSLSITEIMTKKIAYFSLPRILVSEIESLKS